jgi:hypothetical protein
MGGNRVKQLEKLTWSVTNMKSSYDQSTHWSRTCSIFFFMGIERGSLDSSVEKLLLITFSTIKIINFDVNELHLTKKKKLI